MHANGWFFTLVDRGLFGIEHYRPLAGQAGPAGRRAVENDLFAGIRSFAGDRTQQVGPAGS